MYGAAVLDACKQIKARMEPIASKHNFSSFAEVSVCSHWWWDSATISWFPWYCDSWKEIKFTLLQCEQISFCIPTLCQLASACYAERIDLSAHGFYITPEIGFNWQTGKGVPFRYFTYGAAFAEVEIDTLTGDFHTREANVFLDIGYSLNPAIDVGQVKLVLLKNLNFSKFYIRSIIRLNSSDLRRLKEHSCKV